MTDIMNHFNIASAEIFILSILGIAILAHLFVKQVHQRFTYLITQLGILGALLLTVLALNAPTTETLKGSFILDPLAVLLKAGILITSFFAIFYSRHAKYEKTVGEGSYYLLVLCSVLGMMVLASARDLLVFYLGLELMALPLYAMIALKRELYLTTEASLKYFVMGSVASGILLFGISLIYGVTGHLNIGVIGQWIMQHQADHGLVLGGNNLLFNIGVALVVAAIAFKLAAAPFHMWAPDVYEGTPYSVLTFLASTSKIGGFVMAIRLLAGEALVSSAAQWMPMLIILAVLSIAIGNVVALMQTNIKRMLAYSAISHSGYMLLGLLTANEYGFSSALFYMLSYALMALGAFAVLLLASSTGFELKEINDLRGLHQRNPWLAFVMLVMMFSMAGVPPTIGFFAKLGVIDALIKAGYIKLAVFAVIFAVIGAYYYLRVLAVIYFKPAQAQFAIHYKKTQQWLLSLNTAAVILLGMFPSSLMVLCQRVFSLKIGG